MSEEGDFLIDPNGLRDRKDSLELGLFKPIQCGVCGKYRFDTGGACGHCELKRLQETNQRLLEDITIVERQWNEEVEAEKKTVETLREELADIRERAQFYEDECNDLRTQLADAQEDVSIAQNAAMTYWRKIDQALKFAFDQKTYRSRISFGELKRIWKISSKQLAPPRG